MQQRIIRKTTGKALTLTLLFSLSLVANATAQKQRPGPPPKQPTLEQRIERLTAELELNESQTGEMRSIVKGSLELAAIDRERHSGDYYSLALANRERIKRDGARIEALLSEEQWTKYQTLKKKAGPRDRRTERETDDLIKRLNLSKEQKAMFFEITAAAHLDIQRSRNAISKNSEQSDFRSGGGGMQVMRAIQQNADKAIEKTLTDEQIKEYKNYKKERDKKLKDGRAEGKRGGRGGKGGGRGGGRGGQ
jgi:hypothetical protein